jgi:RNA polymerase sigma-70 factor (ECF subfamily)
MVAAKAQCVDLESVSMDRASESGVFRIARRIDAVDSETSDEVLVLAMIDNVPSAWREFQRRYERLIYRCITKVTRRFASVVTPEDLREIYSTLVLSLLTNDKHKLRTFDPERGNRFSTWMGLLAINCAYDHLRAVRREPNKGTLAEAADLVCKQPDAFEQVSEHERAQIASRALDGFSDKDRTFAVLYFGEGMEPTEIARTMKISVKTVYSKKHKIQSRLESMIEGPLAGSGQAAA